MLGAIFGTLLMGCSDEEIANVETSSRNAIGFNVLSNAAETRATPITNSNLTSTNFDVFAFTGNGTAFMGTSSEDFGHAGVKIVYKNGKWDYDDPNDLRYWPNEALDFYAFNPTAIEGDKGFIICGKPPRMNKRYIIPASMSMEAPMVMKTTT